MAELIFLPRYVLIHEQTADHTCADVAFDDATSHLDAGFYLAVLVHYGQNGLHATVFHQV